MIPPSFPRKATSLPLVLSFLLLHLTAGAVIRKANTTSLGFTDIECTNSGNWLGHKLVVENCNAATNKLYNVEVLRHGLERYEFLGVKAKPVTKYKTMHTPRRYTVGKPPRYHETCSTLVADEATIGACTLVIAMLDVFGEGDLPNPPEGPFYDTDVASFRDLQLDAGRVDLSCVVLQHSGGYRVAGNASPSSTSTIC